MEHTLLNYQVN